MAAKEKVSDLQTLLGYKTYHETLWIFHNYHPQCFIIVTKRYNPQLVGLFLKWYTWTFDWISCIYIKEELNEIVSLMKKNISPSLKFEVQIYFLFRHSLIGKKYHEKNMSNTFSDNSILCIFIHENVASM